MSVSQSEIRALAERELGSAVESICQLSAGLGTRRFFRVRLASPTLRSVIARVEGPLDPARAAAGLPEEPPLEPIRAFFERHGLPVPRRFGGSAEAGIDFLEDAGDESLERRALGAQPGARRMFYREACEAMGRLQRLRADSSALPCFERQLDNRYYAFKAERVTSIAIPSALGREASATERDLVAKAFRQIANDTARAPARLAHRDFKAANLHIVGDSRGGERLMWLDLQGSLMAPPEYDLVCLLHDAQVDLSVAEIEEHLEHARSVLPDAAERSELARRFQLLTLTRVGKDLSLFLAAVARGDERYRASVVRAGAILARAARRIERDEPGYAELASLLGEVGEKVAGSCAR